MLRTYIVDILESVDLFDHLLATDSNIVSTKTRSPLRGELIID